MSDSVPTGHHPEQEQPQGAQVERVQTSPEQVEAKGQAETAAVHAAQTAGAAETAELQPMMDWVMTKADVEEQTCFGVAIPDGMLPVEVAEMLCQIKADKGLPLENLPDPVVGKFLQDELALSVRASGESIRIETAEAEDLKTETDQQAASQEQSKREEKQQIDEGYAQVLAEHAGRPNTEKIPLLANDQRVPEAERAKLQAFAKILTIASANETDKTIVAAAVNQIDLANPPSAANFARSFIFDSPDSTIKTGVSEATQAAIAESLGIALPKEPLKTGGDVNDVYRYGGTETYTDENGEKKTRRVPLPKDARVPFTKESEIGFDKEGNKTLWVTTQGGEFNSRLPENPTDEDIGNIIRTVQLRGKLHALNIAYIVPDFPCRSRILLRYERI